MADIGGGGLMDIGCYCISLARFIFGSEPQKVLGKLEYDLNSEPTDSVPGFSTLVKGHHPSPVPPS